MDSVINSNYLKSYAEKYTIRIIQLFFEKKSKIRGEEILELTNIRQINLFIIKRLMDHWKKEADKLKSPYFNYEDPNVTAKLQELMNVLSKNIWIDQKHFQPLLMRAVIDTLFLIFSPYEFFHQELTGSKSSHRKSDLLNKKKFIKINNELFEAFLNKIQLSDKDEFSAEEAKKFFNKVCEEINFEPDEPDPYIEKFSEIEPLYLQKIYKDLNQDPAENKSGTESGDSDHTLLNQFQEPKPSLLQQLEKDPSETVLDFHHKQKIDSIRKNISIHQKFMFVKELFQNSDNEFNQVIDYLDQCESRNEALEFLENNYFDTKIWNDEDEVVIDFMSVIDKKFV
jgi:hypothetical protein